MNEEDYEVIIHLITIAQLMLIIIQILRDNKSTVDNVPRQWRLSRLVRMTITLMQTNTSYSPHFEL